MKPNPVKILTFYLPGCYPFAENDEFWGQGFTEWSNVNSWSPFYDGHRIATSSKSLGQYDPRLFEVRKKHGELAREAGIHGFVFYHYWFSGHPKKKVMHEVLENMLEDGEPNVPFCLEWANEPWTRKWDGLEHEYLIKQDYGSPADHREHFEYLNRFFSHKNYIKVNQMPMLCIYRVGHIKEFGALKESYNQLAREAGYPGIYFVELLNHFNDEGGRFHSASDAYAEYQPMYVNSQHTVEKDAELSTEMIEVKDIRHKWKHIVENLSPPPKKIAGKSYYRGMYTGWDNSPRAKGRPGAIDEGGTAYDFGKFMARQIKNVEQDSCNPEKFLFLFAWNEWGEGAVLEDNDLHGGSYLDRIKSMTAEYREHRDRREKIKSIEDRLPLHKKNTAVFLHIYYVEVLQEILGKLKAIEEPFDLYVNMVEDTYTPEAQKAVEETFPDAKILVSTNYGRDWSGFYRMAKVAGLKNYDAVFLVHGKRTFRENRFHGDKVREALVNFMFQDTAKFRAILSRLRDHKAGIACSSKHVANDRHASNHPWLKELSKRIGCKFDEKGFDFSWGSMFAINSAVLDMMFEAITLKDFERIEQSDGLLPHSLERFPFLICEYENLRVDYL